MYKFQYKKKINKIKNDNIVKGPLICSVCKDYYNSFENVFLLECKHKLCFTCYETLKNYSINSNNFCIKCPNCRYLNKMKLFIE